MKILVLGATGRTGRLVMEEALSRGHQLAAIVREPEKLKKDKVEIVQGTPYDQMAMDKAIRGCDAVINTLNVSRKSDNPWASLRAPEDLISKSASHAIRAMKKEGVKRFVALSTIGAGSSWKKSPVILKLMVNFSNLKYAFRDHSRQEEILEKSTLDYTICRAPMLSDKKLDTDVVATSEGIKPAGMLLSRHSAAKFMVHIIENKEFIRETIHISNKPE
ncbi:MAG: NAD(P)H-binding protein [bacterium]